MESIEQKIEQAKAYMPTAKIGIDPKTGRNRSYCLFDIVCTETENYNVVVSQYKKMYWGRDNTECNGNDNWLEIAFQPKGAQETYRIEETHFHLPSYDHDEDQDYILILKINGDEMEIATGSSDHYNSVKPTYVGRKYNLKTEEIKLKAEKITDSTA